MQKMTFEIAWQLTSSPLSLQTINQKKLELVYSTEIPRVQLISQLVLFTQNSISLEALCVYIIVRLPQISCLMHGSI